MKYLYLVFFISLFLSATQAQDAKKHELFAPKTQEKIKLDGELNEAIWQKAEKAKDFFQAQPVDTSFAQSKTEAMITYDENFIYVAGICYESIEGKNVVQSLRRDFDGGSNDFFTIYIDTFKDGINGFTFGVTPLGVQREAMMTDGDRLNNDWDNKWYSSAKIYDDKYIIEMAIPFKTLRFKKGQKSWKVNFARIDFKRNEVSTWVPVPRNFRPNSLAFTGELNFEKPLKKSGTNIAIIPYLTGASSRNHEEGENADYEANVGGDVKIAVTSSLNLDLTFNPDFSQVEVDQQVTNLSRFELFFPERRQFFLENDDLFARFGFSRIRPFFSRRIGLDNSTGTQIPILFGARLSGKVNKNWRVGFLNMQTAKDEGLGVEGQNYTVATFQRQVFSRSNIGGIFVNRQTTSSESEGFSFNNSDYNRIVGLDYNLASKDNKWRGKFFYHQAITNEQNPDQYAHASFLAYDTPKLGIFWNHEYVGKNYQADVGFVPRSDHWRLEPFIRYRIFPKKANAKVTQRTFRFYNSSFWTTDGELTDRFTELGFTLDFANRQFIGFWVSNDFTLLRDSFDPTNTDGEVLQTGEGFETYRVNFAYDSDGRKLFSYSFNTNLGQFFNGNRYAFNFDLRYRIQPIARLSLGINYNNITLPEPFNSADLILIRSRLEFTFTKSLFFTLFTQYNTQAENLGFNARFQWRFKPVSDFFIVYTDNYFSDTFKVRNRALVMKLTYWLNL